MKFIIRLLITAAVAYVLSMILTPHIRIDSYLTALIFSLVLAFLNAILKLADELVSGIHIQSFLWAFIFGLLLSILSSAFGNIEKKLTE
jgi:putative membrane protein